MQNNKRNTTDLMERIISLCKRRGFIFPGSEIYGGLANSWDYGPLGAELKKNIKDAWWKRFVRERTDVVGVDTALVMNPKVWEASGHLKNFTDPLVECKKCHERYRADQIEGIKCPKCGGELTPARQFNLMLKTFLGPAEDSAHVAYFRPETAQGMFVNFALVVGTSRKRLPFGIAQMGKAFRNEITPGNFIFRTREFEQMEIEYFIKPPKGDEWNEPFEMWLAEMKAWLAYLGVREERLYFHEIPDGERAHYSKRTVDIEYEYPFGRKELYGLAYRGDFDLKNHMEHSGEDLRYSDPETGEKYLPHVIEPTWGVDRSVLVAMLEAYDEEEISNPMPTGRREKSEIRDTEKNNTEEHETRAVMRFPKWLAPYKVAVLPLSKKEELSRVAMPLYEELRKQFVCDYDETQSIGKRYRRQDEIGTPYCVTVDFDTINDRAVTVRDRDSMKQERIAIDKLGDYLKAKLEA